MTLTSRVGFVSATGLCLVGIVYIAVVAFGVAEAGLSDPIADPTLAIMEVLTMLSALLFVLLTGAIYDAASAEQKIFGIMALTFAAMMAGITCTVHFVALTAGRQSGFTVLEWPSTLYAAELLAWDVLLGLSLIFAALTFNGSRLAVAILWALIVSGALALIGTLGPIAGNMALQRPGILGYGLGLPAAALMLAIFFRRRASWP